MRRKKLKDVLLQNFISGCREDVNLENVDLELDADTLHILTTSAGSTQ